MFDVPYLFMYNIFIDLRLFRILYFLSGYYV